MNKQEILAEMTELKDRLNKLEKMYASLTPPNKRWRAEKDDEYYYITERGFATFKKEIGSGLDDARYELGNYFETREQAEFEAERLKVITELKEWATPVNEFDWKDNFNYEKKYVLVMGENNYRVKVDFYYTGQICDLYFQSEELAKSAIESVGEDRIIKYYFRRGSEEV